MHRSRRRPRALRLVTTLMKPPALSLREQLELRDGRGCFYCSKTGRPQKPWLRVDPDNPPTYAVRQPRLIIRVRFNVDHVLPRALGGCEHIQNKVWSCIECNSAKGHTEPTMELWRPSVIARLHINCCGEIAANRWGRGLPVLTYPIREVADG